MWRLAEGHAELESAALVDKTDNELKARQAKARGESQEPFLTDADQASKMMEQSRAAVIRVLHAPQDPVPHVVPERRRQRPVEELGCLDEVLYYLAYEDEQSGETR